MFAILPLCSSAWAAGRDFHVNFADCSEFAGEGAVTLASAQKLVPKGYTITGGSAGQAAIVVRVTTSAATL
jgi:hypothetical protein